PPLRTPSGYPRCTSGHSPPPSTFQRRQNSFGDNQESRTRLRVAASNPIIGHLESRLEPPAHCSPALLNTPSPARHPSYAAQGSPHLPPSTPPSATPRHSSNPQSRGVPASRFYIWSIHH